MGSVGSHSLPILALYAAILECDPSKHQAATSFFGINLKLPMKLSRQGGVGASSVTMAKKNTQG